MSAPTTAGWLRTAARRICQGSGILARQLTRRTIGTTRRRTGEWRGGITRWLGESSGTADSVMRWAMLLIAGWLLWHLGSIPLHIAGRILGAARWLLWVATAAWVIAAYRVAGKKPAEVETDAPQEIEAPDNDAPAALPDVPLGFFLGLLQGFTRGGHNVHLATLAEALAVDYPSEGWDAAAVRPLCEALGVPVKQVRAPGRKPTIGVHRDDVAALPPAPSLERPVVVVAAGQNPTTPATTAPATRPTTPTESVIGGYRVVAVDDPVNPARTRVTVTKARP
jgi:hypothetical protein